MKECYKEKDEEGKRWTRDDRMQSSRSDCLEHRSRYTDCGMTMDVRAWSAYDITRHEI